jgi:predicted alpha/beta-hydrolase family hydrolase
MEQSIEQAVVLVQPQLVDTTTVRIWSPEAPGRDVVVVLGHGAGSALDEHVVATVAAGLAARGVTASTFNFAYREAGRRPPDRADRLRRAFLDVAEAVRSRQGAVRTVLGGRSMGGRVASLLAADGHGDGVVALGYPLCPRGGDPDPRRTAHWPRISVPVLFVHGDRDRLCPVAALDEARHEHLAGTAHSAHVVAGADHSFAVRARDDRNRADVDAEVIAVVDRWLRLVIEGDRDG